MITQLLFELELTIEELAKMRMSKSHEEKVTEINYSVGRVGNSYLNL